MWEKRIFPKKTLFFYMKRKKMPFVSSKKLSLILKSSNNIFKKVNISIKKIANFGFHMNFERKMQKFVEHNRHKKNLFFPH